MRVAGGEVPASDIAALALRLHKAGETNLAQHVGTAVDTNRRELGFTVSEREIILRVLGDSPHDGLAKLRALLRHEHALRQRL